VKEVGAMAEVFNQQFLSVFTSEDGSMAARQASLVTSHKGLMGRNKTGLPCSHGAMIRATPCWFNGGVGTVHVF